MYNAIVISGAYGRDYTNDIDAIRDWCAGQDFKVRSPQIRGTYTSKRDIPHYRDAHFTHVRIRYYGDAKMVEIDIQAGDIRIPVHCPNCQGTFAIDVPIMGHDLWRKGVLIQNAMPEVSAANREMLITGICGECFDKLFPPDEDEYEIDDDDCI